MKVIFDNNRAHYDTIMRLSGHIQLMILVKIYPIGHLEFKMAPNIFRWLPFCMLTSVLVT